MDWSVLEAMGIGGIALAIIYFGYKIVIFLLERWKESTEALERNTQAYSKLANVFEKSSQREIEFQHKMIVISEETIKKVTEIHSSILGRDRDR